MVRLMPWPKDPIRAEEMRGEQSERLRERFKNKENHPMLGKKHSIFSRKLMSDKHRGKEFTEEHRKNIGKASTRRLESHNHLLGTNQTSEAKKKRSVSLIEYYRVNPHPMVGKHLNYKRKSLSEEDRAVIKENRKHRTIPSKRNTKPERMMQVALALQGIKFEKHKAIIGQPDIFIEPNICVFVDSDYHHARPDRYKKDQIIWNKPKIITASDIWSYDIKINNELSKLGYFIVRLWDSDIRKNANDCAEKVIKAIQKYRLGVEQ